jgi:hypothetical protein
MRNSEEIILPQVSPALSYYCAGNKCRISNTCHRHIASTEVADPSFSDYDLKMIQWRPAACKFYTIQRKLSI